MSVTIRPMTAADAPAVAAMMQVFYASPAVHTNGSAEIFARDIEACTGDCPYLEGYVFENPSAPGEIMGYAMLAKSFSTEFGCPCIWLEDLYIQEKHRGKGIGNAFFTHIEETFSNVIFRLEVEEENEGAVRLYRSRGYDTLPYMEMKKLH